MQDGQGVSFNLHMHFVSSDQVARKVAGTERKLQNCHYDGKKKGWDWGMYNALHKEQHAIMECIADHGYNGMYDGTLPPRKQKY